MRVPFVGESKFVPNSLYRYPIAPIFAASPGGEGTRLGTTANTAGFAWNRSVQNE